jgi:hypothetical protein
MIPDMIGTRADRGARASSPQERLRACGLAYITWAVEEPGQFLIAFASNDFSAEAMGPNTPWGILEDVIGEVAVSEGWTAREKDDHQIFSWSAVHGLASLIAEQAIPPHLPTPQLIRSTLDSVLRAL